jgi:hypothetical protein
MISTGIRLPLTIEGCFRGQVGDLVVMAKSGSTTPRLQAIGNWNARLQHGSPNLGHSMALEKGFLGTLLCRLLAR